MKTLTKKQTVIPKGTKEQTDLPDDPVKAMRGIVKDRDSMSEALLKERKKDNDLDEKYTP